MYGSMAGCPPRRERYSNSSASSSRSRRAVLQPFAGQLGKAFLDGRRRTGLQRLLEPPADHVDPPQAVHGECGIAAGIGR